MGTTRRCDLCGKKRKALIRRVCPECREDFEGDDDAFCVFCEAAKSDGAAISNNVCSECREWIDRGRRM